MSFGVAGQTADKPDNVHAASRGNYALTDLGSGKKDKATMCIIEHLCGRLSYTLKVSL
jgi:hypothetical protein